MSYVSSRLFCDIIETSENPLWKNSLINTMEIVYFKWLSYLELVALNSLNKYPYLWTIRTPESKSSNILGLYNFLKIISFPWLQLLGDNLILSNKYTLLKILINVTV